MPDLSFATPSYMVASEAHKPDMVEMILWYELERQDTKKILRAALSHQLRLGKIICLASSKLDTPHSARGVLQEVSNNTNSYQREKRHHFMIIHLPPAILSLSSGRLHLLISVGRYILMDDESLLARISSHAAQLVGMLSFVG